MTLLDCEDANATVQSLEHIMGLSSTEILALARSLNPCQSYHSRRLELNAALRGRARYPLRWEGTCWFHGTRVSQATTFENGLQPLHSIIDHIWKYLHVIVKDVVQSAEWQDFRDWVATTDREYRLKLETTADIGPNAILIKDILINDETSRHHSFLQIPEIVECICRCFQQKFETNDLEGRFLENTQPCIVKFTTDDTKEDYLTDAIFYLHLSEHGESVAQYEWNCFAGKGVVVPRERIIKIDKNPMNERG